MEYTYLLLNIGSLIVPLVFSFHPKLLFYKEWKSFFPALAIVALAFIIWDIYFTSIGVWGFNEQYLMGINIFNLPLEEALFFICIPYASVYTYHCFQIFFEIDKPRLTKVISLSLIIILTLVLLFNFNKLYTGVTFSLTLLLLIYIYISNPKWLGIFYLSFAVILIPFFIVNGALTGMFFEIPVVWYNDLENLGIRIISIPIEDSVYALLMLLSTTLIFEQLKKR
jgi:lycopene cyclase domain-containing protein